jgi:outer membrane protein TolC
MIVRFSHKLGCRLLAGWWTVAILASLLMVAQATAQDVSQSAKGQIAAQQASKLAAIAAFYDALSSKARANNPDVRIAQSKLEEARADLNRTRQQVAQRVHEAFFALRTQKLSIDEAFFRLEAARKLMANRGISQEELRGAEMLLAGTQAKQSELEVQLLFLTGRPAAAIGDAKDKRSISTKLEVLLEEALKSHPDIRLAEAKVRSAEAELNRIQLQASQQAVMLQSAINSQQTNIEFAQKGLERLTHLRQTGAASSEQEAAAQRALIDAKAKLKTLETELAFLTGQGTSQPKSAAPKVYAAWVQASEIEAKGDRPRLPNYPVDPAMAEKLLVAFAREVTFEPYHGPLTGLLKTTEETHNLGFAFRFVGLDKLEIDMEMRHPLPLHAVLQAIQDQYGVRFFVRDYGILAVASDASPQGDPIDGLAGMQDFWKTFGRQAKGTAIPAKP